MSTANDAANGQHDDEPDYSTPEAKLALKHRLERENRWPQAEERRDKLMKTFRAEGYDKANAQRKTYELLATEYPPLPEPTKQPITAENEATIDAKNEADAKEEKEAGDAIDLLDGAGLTIEQSAEAVEGPARPRDSNEPAVSGLSDLPADWPQLPPNASLAAEIQWVQANRLRCVRETADSVSVDLTRALTPAPSYGAISWLETSIKAYTKFCDVAAKATAGQDDEKAHIRRERLAIEEIRALLAEMMPPT